MDKEARVGVVSGKKIVAVRYTDFLCPRTNPAFVGTNEPLACHFLLMPEGSQSLTGMWAGQSFGGASFPRSGSGAASRGGWTPMRTQS
jgi:hypothetical protein